MNLKFLETFIWVVRLGGFSAAAERLGTTQAAVSHRIGVLEAEIGARLFEREGRGVRLSKTGKSLLGKAEEIVRLTAEMRAPGASNQTLRGSITIGAIDSIVYTWLPRFLEQVHEHYPLVNVELVVETSLVLAKPVADGLVDLAFMMGPVLGPDINNEEICTFQSRWLAASRLDLPQRMLTLHDLVAYPLLAYSRNSVPYQALMGMLRAANIDLDQIRLYVTNSLATNSRLVSDGIGISMLPPVVMQDQIERGLVRCLDVDVPMPRLKFHAVYRNQPDMTLARMLAAMAAGVARTYMEEIDKKF